MITLRKSQDRGDANHGWLKSKHTFSFADYHDPNHMGFRSLRVINEDRIDGGTGFGTHGHRDMEIISYVISGGLEHQDSMGNKVVISPGEVQRMSAGTGVMHSEQNQFKDQTTHFLQIWILPEVKGVPPSYDQKSFTKNFESNSLTLVGSKDGRNQSVKIHQDVDMYAAKSTEAGSAKIPTNHQRHFWIQVIKGEVIVENTTLGPGDAASISEIQSLDLNWKKNSEFIIFDLA